MDKIQVSLNGKTMYFTSRLEAINFLTINEHQKISKNHKTTLKAIEDGRKILAKM